MNSKEEQGLVRLPSLISRALKPQSQEASLPQVIAAKGCAEVSAFGGGVASPDAILVACNKLSTAFPKQSKTFWELLALRIAERGMTEDELSYAVNETIDNYTYQTLTIADIMKQGRDKRFRLMSYSQMLIECGKNGTTTNDYCAVRIKGCEKPCWVSKAEKIMYHIPDEL